MQDPSTTHRVTLPFICLVPHAGTDPPEARRCAPTSRARGGRGSSQPLPLQGQNLGWGSWHRPARGSHALIILQGTGGGRFSLSPLLSLRFDGGRSSWGWQPSLLHPSPAPRSHASSHSRCHPFSQGPDIEQLRPAAQLLPTHGTAPPPGLSGARGAAGLPSPAPGPPAGIARTERHRRSPARPTPDVQHRGAAEWSSDAVRVSARPGLR